MPAYVIFIRERTTDKSELDAYASWRLRALRVCQSSSWRPTVAKRLEGPVPEGVAIAEFPSMEEAKQWYESPAYQAAAKHRFKGATYRGLIVEGI